MDLDKHILQTCRLEVLATNCKKLSIILVFIYKAYGFKFIKENQYSLYS